MTIGAENCRTLISAWKADFLFKRVLKLLLITVAILIFTSSNSFAQEDFSIPQRIIIEKINLNSEVLTVAKKDGNWLVPENLPATASLKSRVGGTNNIAIWGHRSTIFLRLGELQIGDKIKIENKNNKLLYKVSNSQIITPGSEDWKVISPTLRPQLTLITCAPIGSTAQRLIITANLESNLAN